MAVLPLAGDSDDPDFQFLKKRIVERIIDTVSQTAEIRVLAHSTVQHCQYKGLDIRIVGQNLFVRAVVVGEMIRRQDELLLHVELIDAEDGAQLWGAQFNEPYSDTFAHPEKLADAICVQLRRILEFNGGRRNGRAKRAA